MKTSFQPVRSLLALIALILGGVFFGYFLLLQPEAIPTVFRDLRLVDARPLVVVDAGHGGIDSGARASGLREKELTLEMAERVGLELKRLGMRVVQTRADDRAVPLSERTRIANSYDEPIFVSIHFNTSSATSVSGLETYHTSPKSLTALAGIKRRHGIAAEVRLRDERSEKLAAAVQSAVVEAVGCEDRGVRNKSLRVTRETFCPAVLVECAYLTNGGEAARLRDRSYRILLAQGIADGVRRYVNAAEKSGDLQYGMVMEEAETSERLVSHSRKEESKGQSEASSLVRTQPRVSPGTETYDQAAR